MGACTFYFLHPKPFWPDGSIIVHLPKCGLRKALWLIYGQ